MEGFYETLQAGFAVADVKEVVFKLWIFGQKAVETFCERVDAGYGDEAVAAVPKRGSAFVDVQRCKSTQV